MRLLRSQGMNLMQGLAQGAKALGQGLQEQKELGVVREYSQQMAYNQWLRENELQHSDANKQRYLMSVGAAPITPVIPETSFVPDTEGIVSPFKPSSFLPSIDFSTQPTAK